MTKQEQLAALVCASEEIDGYVCNLSWMGILTEDEAKNFDSILKKIDEVAEVIRHEVTPPSYVYAVWEDWHGIIGYHKTLEGAKKQLMEHSDYEQLKKYPLDYESENAWGWDDLYVYQLELDD